MMVLAKANKQERGAALVMALFALLLLSAIGGFMLLSARTETRIDSNYSNNLRAYYGANSGLIEVRDRLKYSSATTPGGLADRLPTDIAGNANGVLYVLNPSAGEVVDPTDPANKYFDSQLCHDYNSGADAGTRCSSVPTTSGWNLTAQASIPPASGPLPYKWVRINMKTNRQVLPNYCVDQPCATAALDTRICWDGQAEQISPAGALPACDANGMQTVYTLTALGSTGTLSDNSARKIVRTEVVAPSIRPPGAITMDAAGANPVLSDGSSIPGTLVDGRPHDVFGVIAPLSSCSPVAALATDTSTSTSQLSTALNAVRLGIVQKANTSCNADGSNINSNVCTPALWWVRGTDSSPRFGTTTTITTTTTTPNLDGDGDKVTTTTTTSTVPCDSSNPSCYTTLNLASPELDALPTGAVYAPHIPTVSLPDPSTRAAPFIGGPGNQGSGSMYQAGQSTTLPNEVTALSNFVKASLGQPNYTAVSAAGLAPSYGSQGNPAIVVITDTSLKLQNTSLSGYGVLVVPNDLEINSGGNLQWTGIVLVQGGSAQFKVTSGGSGTINGALLLQPASGSSVSLVSTNAVQNSFKIFYSCDAIDMAFGSLPFKLLSSTEMSF